MEISELLASRARKRGSSQAGAEPGRGKPEENERCGLYRRRDQPCLQAVYHLRNPESRKFTQEIHKEAPRRSGRQGPAASGLHFHAFSWHDKKRNGAGRGRGDRKAGADSRAGIGGRQRRSQAAQVVRRRKAEDRRGAAAALGQTPPDGSARRAGCGGLSAGSALLQRASSTSLLPPARSGILMRSTRLAASYRAPSSGLPSSVALAAGAGQS